MTCMSVKDIHFITTSVLFYIVATLAYMEMQNDRYFKQKQFIITDCYKFAVPLTIKYKTPNLFSENDLG